MSYHETVPISVVIPTYNSAPTICRAIDSVLAQTKLPIEIIVVDDCSNDLTKAMVNHIIESVSIVPIMLCPLTTNSGPAVARNTGWDITKGTYVAFLDSDDSWHPQKLEIQYQWMRLHPEAKICGSLCEIRWEGCGSVERFDSNVEVDSRSFSLNQLLIRNRFTTPSVIVTRDIPERFDEPNRLSEDYLLWLRLASIYKLVHRIELPLTTLHKQIHGASGLSSKIIPMFFGELATLNRLRSDKTISRPIWMTAIVWSVMKFIRRSPRSFYRKTKHKLDQER